MSSQSTIGRTPPTRSAAVLGAVLAATIASCSPPGNTKEPTMDKGQSPAPSADKPNPEARSELATFGGGCFWCVEACFQQLKGVSAVESGYAGGTVENPSYKQVCTGTTGHAEVCRMRFDPAQITYDELLEVFWKTHDPTTLNRQGPDAGTQYRSVIFYHSDEQRRVAEQRKQQLDAAGVWPDPIVTAIAPAGKFFPAEEYHQNYFRRNPERGYCQAIVRPKVEKFRKVFAAKLKSPAQM